MMFFKDHSRLQTDTADINSLTIYHQLFLTLLIIPCMKVQGG